MKWTMNSSGRQLPKLDDAPTFVTSPFDVSREENILRCTIYAGATRVLELHSDGAVTFDLHNKIPARKVLDSQGY